MADMLKRWRANPTSFIETVLCDPETGKTFKLLDAERDFLKHAFQLDADGHLLYPEQVFGAPKKSGKTGFAALHMLTTILLFGGRFAEAYALANDQEQATSRVFQAIKRIVKASPLLRRGAEITEATKSASRLSTTPPSPPLPADYAAAPESTQRSMPRPARRTLRAKPPTLG